MTRTPAPLLLPVLSAVLATTICPSAAAQTQSFTASIPAMTTSWNDSVSLPRFDPALGILEEVRVTLNGTIEGESSFESVDDKPATVTLSFAGLIQLQRPDTSVLASISPSANFVQIVGPFDGTIDFGGTSGVIFPGISSSETVIQTSPAPLSDLALFTGLSGNPGLITLPVIAIGTSTGSGAGNLILAFQQEASVSVEVRYTYAYDCDGDGMSDADEIALGAADVDLNGIPDECELDTVNFSDAIALQSAPWNEHFILPRFDPALGSLESARFTSSADSEFLVQIENTEAFPGSFAVSLLMQIGVSRPGGGSPLSTLTPSINLAPILPGFDGIIDFSGPSGFSSSPLSSSDSVVVTSPPPISDLALLTGPEGAPGTIQFPAFASPNTNISGPGTFASVIQGSASAELAVEYTYRLDCDGNGISDLEEIRSGAIDLNGNGIPDFCEAITNFCFGGADSIPGCTNCPCANTDSPNSTGGCVNSTGRGATLEASGVPVVGADTLRFEVRDANPMTFGILLSANNQLPNQGPCPPGSGIVSFPFLDGLRCVGGSALRHGVRATDTNGDIGVTNNGWGLGSGPPGGILASSGFTAGQTRNFQCYYREDFLFVCQTGQNTTQGVSVSFF